MRSSGPSIGPIPIDDIAAALDFVEIHRAPFKGLEAALLTGAERDKGIIAVKADSLPRRQKYSIAHELGHFLNQWHRPVSPDCGFVAARRFESTLAQAVG